MTLEVIELVLFCVIMLIIMLTLFFYFFTDVPASSEELAEDLTSDSNLQGRFLTECAFNEETKPLCLTQV